MKIDQFVFWYFLPLLVAVLVLARLVLLAATGRAPMGFAIAGFGISFAVKSGCAYFDPMIEGNCTRTLHMQPTGVETAKEG
jgi:hypothetical protein